tara:strand:- start:11265 stop:11450 length:186 start_codon:yes stop_codon:yes gene_type:complete
VIHRVLAEMSLSELFEWYQYDVERLESMHPDGLPVQKSSVQAKSVEEEIAYIKAVVGEGYE